MSPVFVPEVWRKKDAQISRQQQTSRTTTSFTQADYNNIRVQVKTIPQKTFPNPQV